VPRGRLEDLFSSPRSLQKKHKLPIACFGHAGDGNIHVNVMVDYEAAASKRRSEAALDELFRRSSRGAARSPANTASASPKNAGGRWPFQRKRANCIAL
jgi:FAD/FMN-containing dehydrogenase